jgi:hypothetical protein
MDLKQYGMEASLSYATSTTSRERTLVYRRFSRAAEAIRFAIEALGPRFLDGCSLEISDGHYFGREIRPLYDDRAYPLRRASPRLKKTAQGCKRLKKGPSNDPGEDGRKAPMSQL